MSIKYGRLYINLATPILYPSNRPYEGLKLDGILGALWAKDNDLGKFSCETMRENIRFPELPLLRIAPEVYGASTMFLPNQAPDDPMLADYQLSVTTHPEVITKSTNWVQPVARLIGSGEIKAHSISHSSFGTGSWKGFQEFYWAMSTPCIFFDWACTGEQYPELIQYFRRIKSDLFGLGAKTRCGFGRIIGIRIQHFDDEKCCHYYEKDGLPTRPIPVDSPFRGKFPKSCVSQCSFRPPYHSVHTRTFCYVPPVSQYLPQNPVDVKENFDFINSISASELALKEYQARAELKRRKKEKKEMA